MTGPIPPKDTKPGSWYWLRILNNAPFPAKWTGEAWDVIGEEWELSPHTLRGWTYLGPCLPPPDHTASVTEAEKMAAAATAVRGTAWAMDVAMTADEADHIASAALTAAFSLHPVSPAVERGEREVLTAVLRMVEAENEFWTAGTAADVATQGIINWIRQAIATLPHPAPPVPVSGDGEAAAEKMCGGSLSDAGCWQGSCPIPDIRNSKYCPLKWHKGYEPDPSAPSNDGDAP